MIWSRRRESFRHPKIYTTTPANKEFHISSRFIWLVIFLILSITLIWFLFYSNYFKVKTITIEGSLNPDVTGEIESLKGKNIFNLVLGNTEKDLAEKQSSIESIQIRRGIPDTLKVKVFVRNPVISWQTKGKTYFVDKNGIVFEQTSNEMTDEDLQKIPKVTDSRDLEVTPGTETLSPEFIDFVKTIADKFNEKTAANITEMKIGETTFQLEVRTDQGWYALFDTTRRPDVQLDVLKKMLDEHRDDIKEYVDLRVPGKAYLK